MKRYGIIMAGGGGTRFWPLSRQKTPKQLLNLSGKELMVNEAIDRMRTVIDKDNIFIVTAAVQSESMKEATSGKILARNILSEPSARNTAACIGYAAMEILKKHGDGVMLVTPADHYIENIDALTEIFKTAIITAENSDKLVTIGLKPTFPATGFGYIRSNSDSGEIVKSVIEFKEKPDEKTAKTYVESGCYTWNSGMFIWKASSILNKLKQYVPDVYESLEIIGESMNTPSEHEVISRIYPEILNISIDYAVMEPAASHGDVLVIPGDCGWHDVGSWDMLNVIQKPDNDGNIMIGDSIAVDTRNSTVYSASRTVAVVGIENIVVVETPDAVMVCSKEKAQSVKKIVDALNNRDRKDLL